MSAPNYEQYIADPDSPKFWSDTRSLVKRLCKHNEDTTQAIMLTLTVALPSYQSNPDTPFLHWLKRVIKNTVINEGKRTQLERRHTARTEEPAPIELDWEDVPDKYKEIASLLIEGYSLKEIAGMLSIHPTSLRRRLTDLRKKKR